MTQENHKDLKGLVKEASRTQDDGDGVNNSVHAFLEVAGECGLILLSGPKYDGDTPKIKHACLFDVSLLL